MGQLVVAILLLGTLLMSLADTYTFMGLLVIKLIMRCLQVILVILVVYNIVLMSGFSGYNNDVDVFLRLILLMCRCSLNAITPTCTSLFCTLSWNPTLS